MGSSAMVKALIEKISKAIESPEPASEMQVRLERSGALRVDVEGFLSSEKGQKDLDRAQELWEREQVPAKG